MTNSPGRWRVGFLTTAFLAATVCFFASAGTVQAAGEPAHTSRIMTELALQLALIMIGARLGGFVFNRFLRGPGVLGELIAGMIIGPYALGGIAIPGWGPVFPLSGGPLPVSTELYGIAMLASIILLFLSGLETDLATFMRYSLVGLAVGAGGIVFSFIGGAACAVYFGLADSFLHPAALFLGTIATATSVGLTARILSEKRRLGSPEGVTILAAAVLDDVLGIVVLAVVVGMVRAERSGGTPAWSQIAVLGVRAILFWVVFMAVGILLAGRLTRVLKRLHSMNTIAAICLGLALLLAGLSEMAGLAMIIGAYIMGLSLSRTDIAYELQDQLRGIYSFLIPVFFCVMGMLVDFHAVGKVLAFGFIFALVAVLAKVIGCGLPAWLMKFNLRGALRVGVGMVPRAEVCLIVAGIGLSTGAVGQDVFGVAVMLSMISTMVAPPVLLRVFENGSGVRGSERMKKEEVRSVVIELPSAEVAEFLFSRMAQAFRNEEFFVHRLHTDIPTYQIRKEDMAFTLIQEGSHITLNMPARYQHIARFIVLEELLSIQDLLDSVRRMKSPDSLGAELLSGVFDR